jgi:hypothetical protein
MAFGPITDAQRVGYQDNVTLALQQKRSRCRDYFTFQPILKGRVALAIEVVGVETAIIDGARGGDTPAIEGSLEDTWMKPRQLEWGKLVEKEDAVKNMTDYTSTYVQIGAAAIARGEDMILPTNGTSPIPPPEARRPSVQRRVRRNYLFWVLQRLSAALDQTSGAVSHVSRYQQRDIQNPESPLCRFESRVRVSATGVQNLESRFGGLESVVPRFATDVRNLT